MGGFPYGIPKITKIESTPEIEKMKLQMETEQKARQQLLRPLGIFIDFVKPIHFKGKKIWALGNRIYPYQKEGETFHEFIIYVLRITLGKEWWESQMQLSEDKQHFIFKCFVKHYEWKKKNQKPENFHNGMWRAVPDGYSRALISLAFDVCSLLHAVHLPDIFLDKLKKYESYQSVRYEIAISAMFARMGYEIQFLDEKYAGQKNQPKHSEFIAVNPDTKEEIIVEVKSKEREGVLHIEGEFNREKEFKSSVIKLYKHALTQRVIGKAFIVFIDMNLPLSPNARPEEVPWVTAITKMRDAAAFSTKGKQSPSNAIVFTNYSYHYGTDQETDTGEWLLEKAGNPEVLIKSMDFGERFIPVLHNYGKVPNIDMNIEV